jgi:hypothetical protein
MLTWRARAGSASTPPCASIGEDRAGIERLVRYCARPPFALERLHARDSIPALASPESRLLYRFLKPDIHGRTELLLTPRMYIDRAFVVCRVSTMTRYGREKSRR